MDYKEYIMSMAKAYYKGYTDILKSKVKYVFENEYLDNKFKWESFLLVLKLNNESESYFKILKYIKKIEKNYKILGLDFQKIIDNEKYENDFIVGIIAIKFDKFNKDIQYYENKFDTSIKNFNVLKEKLNKLQKINNMYRVEINNINFGKTSMRYREIFSNNLQMQINSKNSIVKRLQKGRMVSNFFKTLKGSQKIKISYKIPKNININMDLNEIDVEKITKIKEKIFDNTYDFFVVIKLDNYDNDVKKVIENMKKIGARIIIINDEGFKMPNCITIGSDINIEQLFSGFKYLLIVNSLNDKCENKNQLECSTIFNMNSTQLKEYLINNYIDIFSNLDNNNVIKVMTSTFLNFKGDNYYSGGAERYLIDLHEVCKNLGYKMRIYQDADFEYTRFYRGIEVAGISDSCKDFDYNCRANIRKKFSDMAIGTSKLNIYSSFMEAYSTPISPSVGISHGVAWDSNKNEYSVGSKNPGIDCTIVDSAKNMDKMVSVDTNTANWFQTIDYKLGNTTEYIPNYVDIEEFAPDKNRKSDKIIITYPRRLYEPRGMYMLLDISDRLIKEFKNIEIHFVGKGFEEDVKHIRNKINQYPDNIKLYNRPPEKMHEVYKNSDISLICTLYSEGTSLSCLEAMSSGNAVIATRVGGLTDLVINNFNGKLIEPNKESLYEAICDYIKNKELLEKCKKNAICVAKEFNKNIWQQRWSNIIKDMAKKRQNLNIEYGKIKLYVDKENINKNTFKQKVFELLKNNIVYIVTDLDEKIKDSFGKIQYIKEDAELYFQFNEVYVDSNYTGKILEKDFITLSL